MSAPYKGSKKVAKGHGTQQKTFQKYAYGKNLSSLQAKKEEREVERHKKSAALRKYAKLCKVEGIKSERVNVEPGGDKDGEGKEDTSVGVDMKYKRDKKKNDKASPYQKEERQAQDNQRAKKEFEERREAQQIEIKKKQKVRDESRKLHLKRTSKGQPLMNNRVKDLLSKIEKRMAA